MTPVSLADLRSAKSDLRKRWLPKGLEGQVLSFRAVISMEKAVQQARHGVHAVGLGHKLVMGQADPAMCVRVYVVQKVPKNLLSAEDLIPVSIDGIPTDVVECPAAFLMTAKKTVKKKTPKPKKTSAPEAMLLPPACTTKRRQSQRPLIAGISAGHRDVTSGTLGCFCHSTAKDDAPEDIFMLSNNHVFANVNHGRKGDLIYQPAPSDGGTQADSIGKLHRYVKIKLGGKPQQANRVDAALVRLAANTKHTNQICTIGNTHGIQTAVEDMLVCKHGRTTGYREGIIDDIEYDGLIGMDHSDASIVALFERQLRIVSTEGKPFGLGGDSGSVVVQRKVNKIVGLYFAGPPDGSYGLANRIEDVIQELKITFESTR